MLVLVLVKWFERRYFNWNHMQHTSLFCLGYFCWNKFARDIKQQYHNKCLSFSLVPIGSIWRLYVPACSSGGSGWKWLVGVGMNPNILRRMPWTWTELKRNNFCDFIGLILGSKFMREFFYFPPSAAAGITFFTIFF